jgi:acyl carrier protein
MDDREALTVSWDRGEGAPPPPEANGPDGEAHLRLVSELRALLLETLALEVADPAEDLIDGGLLDSLALVELLFELERKFSVQIDVGALEIESFRSVDRIAQFVAAQRPAAQP